VSHIPLRKEKDCLNCGTIVQGRYCHECGQENVIPKETFWHMVTHFMYDITHFDSKFFETVKDLIFKPGFLSKEYMRGKRSSYLHPIKMYVFTSALFFLLFFSFFAPKDTFKINTPQSMSGIERLELLEEIESDLIADSVANRKDPEYARKLLKLQAMKDTTKVLTWADFVDVQGSLMNINLSGDAKKYKTARQYDSVQQTLPKAEKDGWFKQRLVRKEFYINEKYGADPEAAFKKIGQTILQRLPYMLFISLPLFALILQILYIRRKNFYYADHGVFTIHLYIFSFILLFIVFCFSRLQEKTGWGFLGYVVGLLFILLNFYLYKAMRNFYGQRRFKTFVKYLLTAFLSLIMMIILLAIFFFFSAFEL
jgi:hypothetical protein